jgi:hypothetical protein
MNEKPKKKWARSIWLLIFLATLVIGATIIFGGILLTIPDWATNSSLNTTIFALAIRTNQSFYVCKNTSISSSPCEFLAVNNTIDNSTSNCTIAFVWTAGNGSVAQAELSDMNWNVLANLTDGQPHTWAATANTSYAIEITRILPNSQSGNISWSNITSNCG